MPAPAAALDANNASDAAATLRKGSAGAGSKKSKMPTPAMNNAMNDEKTNRQPVIQTLGSEVKQTTTVTRKKSGLFPRR
jgi:hypothetical protein